MTTALLKRTCQQIIHPHFALYAKCVAWFLLTNKNAFIQTADMKKFNIQNLN